MGSGNRRLVMNTRERALSGDITRLQAFHESDLSQVLFEMFARYSANDDGAPGVETNPAAGATPPYAGILNGLRAYPVNGTVNMLVTPGTMMVENPAPGIDDNAFKYIRDPGITVAGALTMLPGGADVRIDVLECQTTDAILETDNRDIYNNGTGLFAPAMVTKVTAGRLQYRIRAGVEGGGFPGAAAGWVPLLVIRVPAAAATWDDCDLWDVRPLVSEKWNAPFDTHSSVATVDAHLVADETDAAPGRKIKLYGNWKGQWRGQRIDGIAGNYPGGAAYIDINNTTDNLSSNWVLPAAGELWYLYLAFPGGLPGWRKYSPAPASPRQPLGQRGIPVVSSIAPDAYRNPSLAVGLPASCGIGGTTLDCVLLCAGILNSVQDPLGFTQGGKLVRYSTTPPTVPAGASDPLGTGKSTYQFLSNLYGYPRGATSILVEFELALTGAAGAGDNMAVILNNPRIDVMAANGTNIDATVHGGSVCTYLASGSNAATWRFVVEIPVPFDVTNIEVTWNVTSTYVFTAVTQDKLTFLGYRTP